MYIHIYFEYFNFTIFFNRNYFHNYLNNKFTPKITCNYQNIKALKMNLIKIQIKKEENSLIIHHYQHKHNSKIDFSCKIRIIHHCLKMTTININKIIIFNNSSSRSSLNLNLSFLKIWVCRSQRLVQRKKVGSQ